MPTALAKEEKLPLAKEPMTVHTTPSSRLGPMSLDDMKATLGRFGYITSDPVLLTRTAIALHDITLDRKGIVCLLLDGPPGVGKTFLAQTVAKYLEAEFRQLQFTVGVGRDVVMHDIDIAAVIDAQVQAHVSGLTGAPFTITRDDLIIPGVLQETLTISHQKMVVLLLDEIDKAKPTVDSMLLEFLQEGAIQNPTQRGRVITGNQNNILVFITKNNERDITEPLIRRMDVVYLAWPQPGTEHAIVTKMAKDYLKGWSIKGDVGGCASAMITYANKIRAQGQLLRKLPSSPELGKAVADILRVDKSLRGIVALTALFKYVEDRAEFNRNPNESEKLTEERLRRELAGF